MSDSILAAAFNQMLCVGDGQAMVSVLTFDEFEKGRFSSYNTSQLDLDSIHKYTLIHGVEPGAPIPAAVSQLAPVSSHPIRVATGRPMTLYVRTLTGKAITLKCLDDEGIDSVKAMIQNAEGFSTDQQRLLFDGIRLVDGRTLSDYNIGNKSTIQCLLLLRGGGCPTYYISKDLRAPKFDYDFTSVKDSVGFKRGGFAYKRPCGWNRLALNVLEKYGESSWLGISRETATESVPKEWPVSYHGTGQRAVTPIASDGYRYGHRFMHGHGIYSSPDISVAERYAATFDHEGQKYKFVLQNRVNSKNLKVIPASQTGVGEYWITGEHDIRPYGVCFRKC